MNTLTLEQYLDRMRNDGLKGTSIENARNTMKQILLHKKWKESGTKETFEKFTSNYKKGKKQDEIIRDLGTKKNLNAITEEDIDSFLAWLRENRKSGTLNNRKIYIKTFFKKNGKPQMVEHINVKFEKKVIDKNEILTVEDINRMIEGTDSFLYQCVIACLYESGARINELLSIRKDSLIEDVEGNYRARMSTTKTSHISGKEYREVLFIDSAPYIRRLLMYDSSKSDLLFSVKRLAVANHLKAIAAQVDITKKVNPHAFRHAKATAMVQEGYTEPIIKKKMGWESDSRMMGRYAHNDDEDVMDIEREKKMGQSPEKIVSIRHIAQPKKSIVEELEDQNKALMEKMANLEMNEEAIVERLMKRFPGLAGAEA